MFAILVFVGTAGAYALGTWKIRTIAGERLLASVALEGAQAAAFLLVIVRICTGAPDGGVLAGYVVGAMVGTAIAMWDRTWRPGGGRWKPIPGPGRTGPGHPRERCACEAWSVRESPIGREEPPLSLEGLPAGRGGAAPDGPRACGEPTAARR